MVSQCGTSGTSVCLKSPCAPWNCIPAPTLHSPALSLGLTTVALALLETGSAIWSVFKTHSTSFFFFFFCCIFQHCWPGSHYSRLEWMPARRQSTVSLSLFCYQSLQPLNSLPLSVSMRHMGLPAPICLGILWVTWMLGILLNFQSMKVLYLNLLKIMFHYLMYWMMKSTEAQGEQLAFKMEPQNGDSVGHQSKNKISIFKGPGIFFEVTMIIFPSLTCLGCLWSGESWSLNCDAEQDPNLSTLTCHIKESLSPLVMKWDYRVKKLKGKTVKVILMNHSQSRT